ncbi:MAG: hypothetical protein KGI27_15455, partial [Thaumarchaeota archaeon]|nr:hypothetical protein [Nitrososphaerota archaeon]
WPKSTLFGVIPELQDIKTIKPGERFDIKPWESYRGSIPTPKLYGSGNYTLISVALFTFNTHTENVNADEILWSKPLQITVLPENTQTEAYSSMQNSPEFPFVIPVFLASIASLIAFYRIKFRSHIM